MPRRPPIQRSSAALETTLRSGLIERLAEHPRDGRRTKTRALARLIDALEPAVGEESEAAALRRAAALCEAAVATLLWRRGCSLELEVPTRNSHTADFLVRHGEDRFALHVKRWLVGDGENDATLRIPAALRSLERIRRPYLASIRWPQDRSQLPGFINDAAAFLRQASVGDELVARDASGRIIGQTRLLAPWPGDRIVLAVGLDAALDDELPRLQRLLRKAYAQFMPGITNVIFLCGGDRQVEHMVETAVLGSHIERWDRFPPRGHQVAHGRADDGFWAAGRYAQSKAVAWSSWNDARGLGPLRLWLRDDQMDTTGLRRILR